MGHCLMTQGAPKNLPTPIEDYPAGAALASLTGQLTNARIVAEDGTVMNMADLLSCICEQSTRTADAIGKIPTFLGAQTLSTSPSTISVPSGWTYLVAQNRSGEAIEVSHDGVNWRIIQDGGEFSESSNSLNMLTFRAADGTGPMSVVVEYFGIV